MSTTTHTRWLGTRRPWAIAAGAAAPLLVCALVALVRDSVTTATAVLLLVLVVVSVAATGDRVAGLVAALSSGAWFDFFLTEPYQTFTIDSADDVQVAVLLVVIGVLVSEVAIRGLREHGRAGERAGYLDGVLRVAEVIALRNEPPARLVDHVADRIADVLGVTRCRFVAGPVHDARYAVLQADGTVTRGGRPLNVEKDGLPTDEETVVLVRAGAETRGHFVLTAAAEVARPSIEQRRVAVILADQVSTVLGDD